MLEQIYKGIIYHDTKEMIRLLLLCATNVIVVVVLKRRFRRRYGKTASSSCRIRIAKVTGSTSRQYLPKLLMLPSFSTHPSVDSSHRLWTTRPATIPPIKNGKFSHDLEDVFLLLLSSLLFEEDDDVEDKSKFLFLLLSSSKMISRTLSFPSTTTTTTTTTR